MSARTPLAASIIVPTFGRPRGLERVLVQLLHQDFGPDGYEIIVVDDGSPEPVAPAVEAFSARTTIPVRCLRKENGGPASARNYGARAANGEYLLFVDDDISIQADYLRRHLETQWEFGPALVICDFEWKVEGQPEQFRKWHQERADEWTATRRKNGRPLSDDVLVIPAAMATFALLSVRRVDFERAGGIDTGYSYASCEDQDFALRISHAGIPTLLTRKTIAVHLETHNSLRQLCRRQRNGAEDTVRLVRRQALAERNGRQPIERVNGPIDLAGDPWGLIVKKAVKQLVATRALAPLVFGTVSLFERLSPYSRLLPKAYSLVVGAYIQRGWRDGLAKHARVGPLKPSVQVEGK